VLPGWPGMGRALGRSSRTIIAGAGLVTYVLLIPCDTAEVDSESATICSLSPATNPPERAFFRLPDMLSTRRKLQFIGSFVVLFLVALGIGCNGFFVDPVLQTVTVTPAGTGILIGATQQMTATGIYDDGSQKNITGTSSWTTSDQTIATVIPTGGLVKGIGTGTATIQATHGIVSGSTTVIVQQQVTSILVTPSSQSVSASGNVPFCLQAIAQPGSQDISTLSTTTWTFTAGGQTETAGIAKNGSATCTGQGFLITGTALAPVGPPTTLSAVATNGGARSTAVTISVTP
jgi:hypothetical protein